MPLPTRTTWPLRVVGHVRQLDEPRRPRRALTDREHTAEARRCELLLVEDAGGDTVASGEGDRTLGQPVRGLLPRRRAREVAGERRRAGDDHCRAQGVAAGIGPSHDQLDAGQLLRCRCGGPLEDVAAEQQDPRRRPAHRHQGRCARRWWSATGSPWPVGPARRRHVAARSASRRRRRRPAACARRTAQRRPRRRRPWRSREPAPPEGRRRARARAGRHRCRAQLRPILWRNGRQAQRQPRLRRRWWLSDGAWEPPGFLSPMAVDHDRVGQVDSGRLRRRRSSTRRRARRLRRA